MNGSNVSGKEMLKVHPIIVTTTNTIAITKVLLDQYTACPPWSDCDCQDC